MRLRGLIFDMDGTIGDTLHICIEGIKRAAEPLAGRSFSDAEILATFGPSEEGAAKKLVPHDPTACMDSYLRHYEELHAQSPDPFDGIPELLRDIHASGAKLAMVTGKGPRTLAVTMRIYKLQDTFDEVRTGCPQKACKPEKIQEVLDVWGLNPSEVAYVGDIAHDVRSAREAGVKAISVAWASSADLASLKAAEPDWLFETVAEFRNWWNS